MKDNSNNNLNKDISKNVIDNSNNNLNLQIIELINPNEKRQIKLNTILLGELNKMIYKDFTTPLLTDISNNTLFKDISNNNNMKKKSSKGILKFKRVLDNESKIKPRLKGVKKIKGSHRTALRKNLQNYDDDFDIFFKNNIKNYHAKQERLKKIIKKKVDISNVEIYTIQDILDLAKKYPIKDEITYNIDMKAIHNIKSPLIELNKMIGMKSLKESVVNQILFFVQKLHICKNKSQNDFLHTVIYGPPGTGKTEVAKLLGKIYSRLGILKRGRFRKVTRSDLVAGYLGQTALKTMDVVKDCLGGVLFIDEAYALGNPEKRDSFAKECLDTLCEALSNYKDRLMVIIAGYEEELDKCFFSYNQGLSSRFTWRFKTDDYQAPELNKIFEKKVKDIGWKLKKPIPDSWFEENIKCFKYFGRDIETLLAKTKIAHSRRVFCLSKNEKKKITLDDLNKGIEMFKKNNNSIDDTQVNDIYKYMFA